MILARITLLSLIILMGYGLLADIPIKSRVSSEVDTAAEGKGDIDLYQTIITRMRNGESFYDVTGEEQLQRGYPVKPFLTWRLPTSAWLVSIVGDTLGNALLYLLTMLAMLAWVDFLRSAGLSRLQIITGSVMVFSGLVLMIMPQLIYLHETWAGTLIALSLPLRAKYWRMSVLTGIAALAFRELALPYVLVMLGCAIWEGRRQEAFWWGTGLLIFLAGLGLHAAMVSSHIGPVAPQGEGWLAMGGWPFVVATSRWNLFFLLTGTWLAALFLPLLLLGAWAWQGPVGLRLKLTLWCYCLAFLFVGRSNNDYWGIILVPLLGVSLVYAPKMLGILWRASHLDRYIGRWFDQRA